MAFLSPFIHMVVDASPVRPDRRSHRAPGERGVPDPAHRTPRFRRREPFCLGAAVTWYSLERPFSLTDRHAPSSGYQGHSGHRLRQHDDQGDPNRKPCGILSPGCSRRGADHRGGALRGCHAGRAQRGAGGGGTVRPRDTRRGAYRISGRMRPRRGHLRLDEQRRWWTSDDGGRRGQEHDRRERRTGGPGRGRHRHGSAGVQRWTASARTR